MTDIAKTVENLNVKVEKLIHLHKQSVQENNTLLEDNQQLKKQLIEHGQEIKNYQEKLKVLKLAKSIAGNTITEGGTVDLKLKINEILREIDKCIALLNK